MWRASTSNFLIATCKEASLDAYKIRSVAECLLSNLPPAQLLTRCILYFISQLLPASAFPNIFCIMSPLLALNGNISQIFCFISFSSGLPCLVRLHHLCFSKQLVIKTQKTYLLSIRDECGSLSRWLFCKDSWLVVFIPRIKRVSKIALLSISSRQLGSFLIVSYISVCNYCIIGIA